MIPPFHYSGLSFLCARLLSGVSFQPDARFSEISRKEIFDRGLTKALGEKSVNEIPPLLISDNRDLGDIFGVLDQEADIASVAVPPPAAKIVENE